MKLVEEKGDLFKTQDIDKYVIVHCISRDGRMGAGFAKTLCNHYKGLREFTISEIKRLELTVPSIVNITVNRPDGKNIRITNLITKEFYFNKPTLNDIKGSLIDLKNKCVNNNIENILLPRIASGLDGHNWAIIKKLIISIFNDTNINILIKH